MPGRSSTPRLNHGVGSSPFILIWAVWVVFVVDYVIRVTLAGDQRRDYVWRHWYDVPLRVLRLLVFARMVNRAATGGLIERAAVYVAGVAIMAMGLGSVAILDAEQNAPGANITSLGDALWWSCATVTTVGYRDRYPVATDGRVIAVVLMLVGIGLVGAITASVATWMVSQVWHEREPTD
jgi:voltage-gated potassium channel